MRDDRDVPVRFIECRRCGQLLAVVRTVERGRADLTCRRCRYHGEYDYFPIGFSVAKGKEHDDGQTERYQ